MNLLCKELESNGMLYWSFSIHRMCVVSLDLYLSSIFHEAFQPLSREVVMSRFYGLLQLANRFHCWSNYFSITIQLWNFYFQTFKLINSSLGLLNCRLRKNLFTFLLLFFFYYPFLRFSSLSFFLFHFFYFIDSNC